MTFSPPPGPCDLSRSPLAADELRARLTHTRWRGDIVAPERTSSTNTDLASMARDGAPTGSVVAADRQDAGKGRLGRSFALPGRSGVAVSALIRPVVPIGRWSWLPLVAGLAVDDLVRARGVRGGGIKWPNDVLVDGRKICGILLERVETPGLAAGAVIGIGLNIAARRDELPTTTATSLALEGARGLHRRAVLVELLEGLDHWLTRWEDPRPDAIEAIREAFLERCVTLGQHVRIERPGGDPFVGTAETVDGDGRLIVDGAPFSSGDVVHVRPAG
ncbi:biotin--[acetyl-CoA-carboxylase] ligase [Aeromicrobium sp. YIM 150415]|uniref:biotin--[acetyl-CoA-carboxylase] ligase n=1 Tax=Aeromicrobium sp. YIM 150415 TaxID=2803912 RepID=UPI0019639054|nr:biotin--[acetyl-CoA-carboxylase] ligase [Aeromicrobium sp. YIM 150415]MBM9462553.1 biotin--[acetyl-CoA-carboxylase] ligase [Aeromicrobium sp. YIM 150415]